LEAKQASQILNESKDLYLKEVADNAGIFVLFADSKEQGWVFPNPRLRKLEPELQALFPHLTKAVLDHTETYVEPVLVRYVSDGRWKVEFNGSSAFHNEKIESPTIVEPTREAFNNSVINGTTTSAKPAPEVTPRAATEAAPSRKPRVEFKSLVNRNRSTIIPGLLLGVGIFIIIAVVLLGISRLLDRIGNQNANIPNANSSPTPQPSPPPPAKPSPPGMAYVQGGDFMMGNNEGGNELEKPEHKVNVPAFYIDKYEVTCEQYAKFVKESNHPAPPGWINGNYPSGAAKLPVTGVSWYDAKAYARWAGKRLPSEAEWELAARGYDKRLYPWGNVWKLNAANAGETSAGRIVEVGSYKDGLSPAEAYDMIGNVWEWTSSELTSYTPRQPLPATLANGRPVVRGKVIRGGGWASKGIFATTTYRIGYQPEGEKSLYLNTGFRCAMDAPP
jgi:formylglycine-generating enzyme required for sulfatase activity